MVADTSVAGLHLRKTGTGPPLLLIHGWAMSGRAWRFQEPLASRWQLLMPDLPGHGFSPAPSDLADLSVPLVARELVSLLDDLGIDRLAVIGWSLGALVALRMTELLGCRLAGLVLVAGTAHFCADDGYPHGLPQQDVRGLGLRLRRDYGGTLGDFFKRMFAANELDHDQYQRIVREVVLGGRQPTPEVAQAGLLALAGEDVRSLLPAISAPVLIMHGMADTICPASSARYLADTLPHALLQLMPGVGHAPFLTRPEEFNTLVAEFLAEVWPG